MQLKIVHSLSLIYSHLGLFILDLIFSIYLLHITKQTCIKLQLQEVNQWLLNSDLNLKLKYFCFKQRRHHQFQTTTWYTHKVKYHQLKWQHFRFSPCKTILRKNRPKVVSNFWTGVSNMRLGNFMCIIRLCGSRHRWKLKFFELHLRFLSADIFLFSFSPRV